MAFELLVVVIVYWIFRRNKLPVPHGLPQGIVSIDGVPSYLSLLLIDESISLSRVYVVDFDSILYAAR